MLKKKPFLLDFALQLDLIETVKRIFWKRVNAQPCRAGRGDAVSRPAELHPAAGPSPCCRSRRAGSSLTRHRGSCSPTPGGGLRRAGRAGVMPHKAAAAVITPFEISFPILYSKKLAWE